MATGGTNHIDETTEQKSSKNITKQSNEHRRRLILISKCGNGKSSTGNGILNQKLFSVSSSSSSHTKHCRVGYRIMDGIELVVCDTPGMFDTSGDSDAVKTEIRHAVDMVYPGPHAFLIHFKIGNRFTDEEKRTIEEIQDMFGVDASKYCILILTGEDNLIYNDETIEDYLANADPGLKHLLAQCHNRYITFNNRAQQNDIDERIRQLLSIIEKMLVENETAYYSKEQLQRATQILQERERAALEAKTTADEKERQALYEQWCQMAALRERTSEERQRELSKTATASTSQNHGQNIQQGPSLFDKFCSALPHVTEALVRGVTVYSQLNQTRHNDGQEDFYFGRNNPHRWLDDSSSPLPLRSPSSSSSSSTSTSDDEEEAEENDF